MKKVLFLLLIIPFFVNAEKIIREELIYGDFYNLMDVVKDKEGNYYLSGNEGIQKYNANKELVIKKTLPGYSVCYSITIDDDENLYAMCDKETFFEGFNIPHFQFAIFNVYMRIDLVKLDNQLNVIKTVDFLEQYNMSNDRVIEYKDNYLYIIGYEQEFIEPISETAEQQCFSYSNKRIIYKLDLEGNIIFKKDYSVAEQNIEKCFFKVSQSNTGFGTAYEKTANIIFKDDDIFFNDNGIYRYDVNGNKKWGLSNIVGDKIATTNDGNFVVGHIKYAGNNKSLLFSIINPDGEIIDEKSFSVTGNTYIKSIDNYDSGYYVTLKIYTGNVEGINNGKTGSFIVKYDYNFNIKDVLKLDYEPFYTKILDDGLYMYQWEILSKISSDFSKDGYTEKTIKIDEVLGVSKLFDLHLSDAIWSIDDPSILEIKDGSIIPKKIGSTIITTTYDGNSYKANITIIEIKIQKEDSSKEIKVEEKRSNPETKDLILLAMILFLLSNLTILAIYYKIRRKQKCIKI